MEDTIKKIIYEDHGKTKIIRGRILKEDDFTYTIRTEWEDEVILGKRAIIKIGEPKAEAGEDIRGVQGR